MKICVVTGANSGIGKAIAGMLLKDGCKVYSVGGPNGFAGEKGENETRIVCDFRTPGALEALPKSIPESRIDSLVNAAGLAFYGIAETVKPKDIADMVDVNVKAPLVLTSALMPSIRAAKGIVVNISSVTALQYANPHGAAYGASKAALTSFGRSLFEEYRKHGVRVVNIHPDLTDTNLYRNADFGVTGEADSTLFAEDIAEAVRFAVNAREGECVSEITVRPQRNRIRK